MKWLIIRLMQPMENRIICRAPINSKKEESYISRGLSGKVTASASRENGCIFESRTFGRACGKRKWDRDSHSPSAVLNLRANPHTEPASLWSGVEDYYE